MFRSSCPSSCSPSGAAGLNWIRQYGNHLSTTKCRTRSVSSPSQRADQGMSYAIQGVALATMAELTVIAGLVVVAFVVLASSSEPHTETATGL